MCMYKYLHEAAPLRVVAEVVEGADILSAPHGERVLIVVCGW